MNPEDIARITSMTRPPEPVDFRDRFRVLMVLETDKPDTVAMVTGVVPQDFDPEDAAMTTPAALLEMAHAVKFSLPRDVDVARRKAGHAFPKDCDIPRLHIPIDERPLVRYPEGAEGIVRSFPGLRFEPATPVDVPGGP